MPTPRAALPRDLEQRLRNLETKIKAAATAATRRPKYEVSEGDLTVSGGDLVVDGGDFLLLDTDGSTVFRLGPQEHGDRGVVIYREEGTPALSVRRFFPNSTTQTLEVYDRAGNVLLGESSIGNGISRPVLDIPLQPVQAAPGPLNAGPWGWEVTAAGSTWTTVYQSTFLRQNQFGHFRLRVRPSDATTAGEVRLVNAASGNPLGEFLGAAWLPTVAAGGTGYTELVSPALWLPFTAYTTANVELQVRRTAGAGTLSVAVVESRGAVA